MKYDAVLEGGGVKIPGLVGGLHAIESKGFEPSHLAGTSAGSIVAALRVAGYTPEELRFLVKDLDFKSFKDGNGWGRKAYNILRHKGIYKGDVFYETIKHLLYNKGIDTFGDLKNGKENHDPRYRYRLKIFAADISYGRLVAWPDDAGVFDLDPDYIEVAWAVRTSMSIPYFFRPVQLGDSHLVDGGVLSNFPIWTWDSYSTPNWPTFGILLQEAGSGDPHKIKGPISFMEAMFQTMLKAHDRRFIRPEDYRFRTIRVPVGDTKATNFNITDEEKDRLFHNGARAGGDFLQEWKWDEYVQWAKRSRNIM